MSKVDKIEKRPKTGGRNAGTPNKLSATVKDNVVSVFNQIGGVDHMANWASENPNQFYNIYAKLMPLQVEGAGDAGEHLHSLSIKFVSTNK